MAYKAFRHITEFSGKEILGAGVAILSGIVIIQKVGSKNVDETTVIISLLFVVLYTLIFYLFSTKKYQASAMAVLMLCCVCAEAISADTDNYSMDRTKTDNLVTGLPKTVKVSSEETEEALRETTAQIVETIHSVLEKTPPELAADIADRGIVLTGGGSLLRGLEDLISAKTGINTMTAEDPMTAVAIGTGKYVEFLAGYRDN